MLWSQLSWRGSKLSCFFCLNAVRKCKNKFLYHVTHRSFYFIWLVERSCLLCLRQLPGLFTLTAFQMATVLRILSGMCGNATKCAKCYIGRSVPVSWRCLRMFGCKQSPSCTLTNFGAANTSSVTMLCGRLRPRPLKLVQSPNESGIRVAPDSCNFFGQGPHHLNPFNELKTKEIDKSMLLVDWKSYVSHYLNALFYVV